MEFLEDARQRGVLRTVGPAYKFRRRELQDRLAEMAAPSGTAEFALDRDSASESDKLATGP
jgi:hypothetical protein